MKEIGLMIRDMDKDLFNMILEINILENGLKIENKVIILYIIRKWTINLSKW